MSRPRFSGAVSDADPTVWTPAEAFARKDVGSAGQEFLYL
jgi:hypothetical protein